MAKVTSGSFNTTKYDGRYYTFSWTATQDITKNQSSIAWTLEAKGGNSSWYAERTVEVVVAGETVYNKTNKVNRYTGKVASGTKVITHNTNGSKSFSASVQAAVYTSSVNCTGSGNWDLKDIPRAATITSAPNFNDEANPTISYSNAAGNAVSKLEACISLDGSKDDVPYREISKTGTSYTFSLTTAERNTLRKAITTGNYRAIRFYVQTTIGTTVFRNYVTKNVTLINYTPTLNPTVEDVGSVSTALTGDSSKVIKYYNVLKVNSGGAARKQATIKSQKITCGSKSINSGSGELGYIEADKVTFSITDSRGYTTTKDVTLNLIPYVKLSTNLTAKAELVGGATATVNFTVKGNYWSGNFGAVENSLQVYYRYRANNESYGDWVELTPTINAANHSYTITSAITGLNYENSYTLQAKVVDAVNRNGITSKEITVKTTPVFDWSENDFNFNTTVYLKAGKALTSKTNDGGGMVNMAYLNAGDNLIIGGGNYPPNKIYITTAEQEDGSVIINGKAFAKNKVLWSGASYMRDNQTAKLSENISKQTNGIALIFSYYNIETSAAENHSFNIFFVPKAFIELMGSYGCTFHMSGTRFSNMCCKYLYIHDDKITGNANNDATGTNGGITYANNKYVLRYVIGV